ncbi:fructosamine kinase family protein [Novosphingobium malaysiense]|uniref:Aminoglycoside phosphotransferase n=1 Tax=Novosphingobium malaysiense TaxID=1348853 RepID=A0A0B1ZLH0_9SPHN|nr:fructosamine kinase family protein [Novosphingobium malaysiense]KHK91960.1 aminoglycoside phosphotransferase [Novosphingobium malaysiense]
MAIETRIAALFGQPISTLSRLHGGDLSTVYRVTLMDGTAVVAKQSSRARAEAAMLLAIRASSAPAPEVLAIEPDLMVIEYVATGGRLASAWPDLAHVLDRLHGTPGETYGWPEDYAFGDVQIVNTPHDDWPEFWAERRLLCHLPLLPAALARRIEVLSRTVSERLPASPAPSLLHGDLWGGNILAYGDAISGLIDPACYYGHREVDLAMLTLFDHPPGWFFEMLDLEPGWQERQPLYRLWPWLVHLRLFGGGYRSAVEACLAELGV